MVAEPIYLHERHMDYARKDGAEPFAKMPLAVLGRHDLSNGAKVAYAALRSFAWDEGHCRPGIDAVAERMGASARRAWAYMKELEEKGLIVSVRRGQGQTNTYTLLAAPSLCGVDLPEVTSLDSPEVTNHNPDLPEVTIPDSPLLTNLDLPEVTSLDSPEVTNRIDTVKVDTVKVDTDNTIAPLRQRKDGQEAMPATDPPPAEDVDLAKELCAIIGMSKASKASVASMADVVQEFRPLARRPLETYARACAAFHDAKTGRKRAPNTLRLRNWLENEMYGFRKKDGARSEPAGRPAPSPQRRAEQEVVTPETQAIRDQQAALQRVLAAEKDWYCRLLAEQPADLSMMQRGRRVSALLEADPGWHQKARAAAGL